MTSGDQAEWLDARRLVYLVGVWLLLGVGCGAAVTFVFSGVGGEAFAFLIVGSVFGVVGGTAFGALCIVQRHRTGTLPRFAASGAAAALIAVVLPAVATGDSLTPDRGFLVAACVLVAIGAVFGLLAGIVATEFSRPPR